MGITIKDQDGLERKLLSLSRIRYDAVIKKNMTQIYNRGKAGGTPVDTGELRISLRQSGDLVGYTKDYAPHVEYGHRTVNGGFVQGQRFLKRNVDAQRAIFRQDLIEQIRKC